MTNEASQIYKTVQKELNPGETILWSDQAQGIQAIRNFFSNSMMIGGLFMMGSAFLVYWLLGNSTDFIAVLCFQIFPIIVFILGLGLLLFPIISSRRSATGMIYAITNKRALIITNMLGQHSVQSFTANQIGDIRQVGTSELGSVYFGKSQPIRIQMESPSGETQPVEIKTAAGFQNIRNPGYVAQLLRDTFKTSPSTLADEIIIEIPDDDNSIDV